jgi:phenylacetic acid degradation operon negative regulatory protein
VTREARAANDRAAFRNAMRRCRYAELREGAWARPDNLPRASAPDDVWAIIDAQCSFWTGRPDGDERTLTDELFAPKLWADRAHELSDGLAAVTAALRGGEHDRLADAFVAGAATLQHVRNDPLLPREVLPGRWPGTELRDTYRTYQRAFTAAAGAWFREVDGGPHQ